jgi:hypothetical protein
MSLDEQFVKTPGEISGHSFRTQSGSRTGTLGKSRTLMNVGFTIDVTLTGFGTHLYLNKKLKKTGPIQLLPDLHQRI